MDFRRSAPSIRLLRQGAHHEGSQVSSTPCTSTRSASRSRQAALLLATGADAAPVRQQRARRPCLRHHRGEQEMGERHPNSPTTASRRATASRRPGKASPRTSRSSTTSFQTWFKLGIGISFRSRGERGRRAGAHRLRPRATDRGRTSGRDVLNTKDAAQRTMNFGWALTTPYGHDTALHEIGHTLGLRTRAPEPERRHHLEPRRGAELLQRARRTTGRKTQIDWNILRKIPTVGGQGHRRGIRTR